jgi:hypothetical protein
MWVNPGDLASLLALELIASLGAYNRASLPGHPGGDRRSRPNP